MGYIYQIKNKVNGKSYIGQTMQEDVRKRWNGHINAIKSNTGCPLLQIAVQKYGLENFEFKVIIICFDEDLNRYEKEYIKRYNTFGKDGYNASTGGEPGGTFAGHTHTMENRALFSRINIEYGSRPEVRQHRHELMIKRFSDPEVRKRHGECMRKAREARKENGTDYVRTKEHCENISRALKERCAENIINSKPPTIDWSSHQRSKHSEIMSKVNGRSVCQYTIDGNLVATYPTIRGAAKKSGIGEKAISANLSGRVKITGGFVWKYTNTLLKEL
jgi:group I intron endonuclease